MIIKRMPTGTAETWLSVRVDGELTFLKLSWPDYVPTAYPYGPAKADYDGDMIRLGIATKHPCSCCGGMIYGP